MMNILVTIVLVVIAVLAAIPVLFVLHILASWLLAKLKLLGKK